MEHIYGVPALADSDQIGIIGQWSRALARALAARDAAIVRDTGTIPEGDPETVAGMVARLAAAEALLDELMPGPWVTLTLRNGWTAYTGGGGYFNGLRARATATGVQLDGMVKGSSNGEIATIPDSVGVPSSVIWSAAGSAGGSNLEVSSGTEGKAVKSRSGNPAQTSFLSISNVIPYA